ncbi:putative uncharacterized protein [Clostridium sp. CAG:411]|nr:putative uncharacterized protein [Clostridium sp. CAG:411]
MTSVLLMWMILIAIFIVVEIITLGLTTVWFVGGAVVALIAGAVGADIGIQVVLFFVVSVALLFFVRPSACRRSGACRRFNSHRVKTDIETIIGAEGKVLETIDNFNQKGVVALAGKEWTARSADASIIPEGAKVSVVEISGVKLIVTQNETVNVKKEEE